MSMLWSDMKRVFKLLRSWPLPAYLHLLRCPGCRHSAKHAVAIELLVCAFNRFGAKNRELFVTMVVNQAGELPHHPAWSEVAAGLVVAGKLVATPTGYVLPEPREPREYRVGHN